MEIPQGGLVYQELSWLLGSLCNLYRIPFDPKLIEQEFPPPHSFATFHEAARALGFKTGKCAHPAQWQQLPLPAIALLRGVPATESQPEVKAVAVLILKADGHTLLYFRPGGQVPETITVDEARLQFEPELILVTHEAPGKEETVQGFDTEK